MERARSERLTPLFDVVRRIEALHEKALELIHEVGPALRHGHYLGGPFNHAQGHFTLEHLNDMKRQVREAKEAMPETSDYREPLKNISDLQTTLADIHYLMQSLPEWIAEAAGKLRDDLRAAPPEFRQASASTQTGCAVFKSLAVGSE